MTVCEICGIIIGFPLWSILIPVRLPWIFYSLISYGLTLALVYFLSKLTKLPLIGPFISLIGELLFKFMLSIGLISLVLFTLCLAGILQI